MIAGGDIIGRLGVYTLDGSTDQRSILPFIINKDNLDSYIVVIVLDMLQPWRLLESLKLHMQLLASHIATLGGDNLERLKKKSNPAILFHYFMNVFVAIILLLFH